MFRTGCLVVLSAVVLGFELVPGVVSRAEAQPVAQDPLVPGGPDFPLGGPGVCPPGSTSLCLPLDPSFSVALMDATGGDREADANDPCQRNNDDSTLAIPLQFTFDFYGSTFDEVYINNNGSVTFGAPSSAFTPTGFPSVDIPRIAPFWADVDTGGPAGGGGVVYFKSEANRFTVIWDHVGYFDQQFDRTNTFQLILSDGTDPLVGIGNNVCFCWDDLQWTTGDSSGGVGGFGGTAATVGANLGDGVNFFLVGRFDHPGTDSDGPGGNNDGVDSLDNRSRCFSTLSGNLPPRFIVFPSNNKVTTTVGREVSFVLEAIGPEDGETVTMTGDDGGLANYLCTFTPGSSGNPASARCNFTPDGSQVGDHFVSFTATDDGAPPESTTVVVCLTVESDECTEVSFDDLGGTLISAGTEIQLQYADVSLEVSGLSSATGNPGAYTGEQGGPGSETADLVPSSAPNYLTTSATDPPRGRSDHGVIRFDFRHSSGAPRSAYFVSLTFLDIEDSGALPEGRGSSFLRGLRQNGSFVDVPVPVGLEGGQAVLEIGTPTGVGEEALVALEAHIGDEDDSGAIDDLCFSLNPDRPLELGVGGDLSGVVRGASLLVSIGLRNHEAEPLWIRFEIEVRIPGQSRGRIVQEATRRIPGFLDNLTTNRFLYPLPIPASVPDRLVGVPLELWVRARYVDREWIYSEDVFPFVIE